MPSFFGSLGAWKLLICGIYCMGRFLRVVDKFNDLLVSVYATAGHTKLMLLHDSRNEDGIKNFFQEVHELYIKVVHLTCYCVTFHRCTCSTGLWGTCYSCNLMRFFYPYHNKCCIGTFELMGIFGFHFADALESSLRPWIANHVTLFWHKSASSCSKVLVVMWRSGTVFILMLLHFQIEESSQNLFQC